MGEEREVTWKNSTNKCRKNKENTKSSLVNTTVMVVAGKVCQMFVDKRDICLVPKYLPPKCLLIRVKNIDVYSYKGKN